MGARVFFYAAFRETPARRMHEPNLPSGGQVADIGIGAFLIATGNGPEKQELLRLIGTLISGFPRGPARYGDLE
jgi:hypothetical protein